jgi:hypothetical protein
MKICNPASSELNQSGFCQHTLDRIGLSYNCPSKYTVGGGHPAGEFEVCDSTDMVVPGEFTDASGATQSYAQPPESLGPITSIPYTVTAAVASSNCKQTPSAQLFTDAGPAPTGSASGSGGASAPTGAPSASSSGSGAGAGTTKPTGSGTTSAPSSSTTTKGNGARRSAAGTVGSMLLVAGVFVALL